MMSMAELGRHGWRSLWTDPAAARRAMPDAVAARLAQRVAASEARHRGEIRVCVEAAMPLSWWWPRRDQPWTAICRARALDWFSRLGVWDTANNTGVLIYLLLSERRIEVVADRGLSSRVDGAVWHSIVERLSQRLRASDGAGGAPSALEDGLTEALSEVSALLVAHCPPDNERHDANELPDTVVRV